MPRLTRSRRRRLSMKRFSLCVVPVILLSYLAYPGQAADIFIGSGCKSGEVTDTTAIVLVRLTSTPGQDANGNIPGREGEARLHYGPNEALSSAVQTPWRP